MMNRSKLKQITTLMPFYSQAVGLFLKYHQLTDPKNAINWANPTESQINDEHILPIVKKWLFVTPI